MPHFLFFNTVTHVVEKNSRSAAEIAIDRWVSDIVIGGISDYIYVVLDIGSYMTMLSVSYGSYR